MDQASKIAQDLIAKFGLHLKHDFITKLLNETEKKSFKSDLNLFQLAIQHNFNSQVVKTFLAETNNKITSKAFDIATLEITKVRKILKTDFYKLSLTDMVVSNNTKAKSTVLFCIINCISNKSVPYPGCKITLNNFIIINGNFTIILNTENFKIFETDVRTSDKALLTNNKHVSNIKYAPDVPLFIPFNSSKISHKNINNNSKLDEELEQYLLSVSLDNKLKFSSSDNNKNQTFEKQSLYKNTGKKPVHFDVSAFSGGNTNIPQKEETKLEEKVVSTHIQKPEVINQETNHNENKLVELFEKPLGFSCFYKVIVTCIDIIQDEKNKNNSLLSFTLEELKNDEEEDFVVFGTPDVLPELSFNGTLRIDLSSRSNLKFLQEQLKSSLPKLLNKPVEVGIKVMDNSYFMVHTFKKPDQATELHHFSAPRPHRGRGGSRGRGRRGRGRSRGRGR